MNSIEKAIESVIAQKMAEAEKRILERLENAADQTLTFTQACEYLQMSDYSLRRLCHDKRIPHRTHGAEGSKNPRYLFSTVSLDRWKRDEEERNYRPSQH